MDVNPVEPDPRANAPTSPDLDVERVEADASPVRLLRRLTGPREPGFTVVIQREALDAIHAHGRADTSVEICGVLVGEVRHDRISTYLLITAHIPGDKATSKEAQVTFTAETWNAIQAAMEKDFPDKKIVGWYHTHPGFGIFLSGMDLFIQDNFFNLPWQVAWVYDPVADTDGVFVWRAGKSERADFLIEEAETDTATVFRPASVETPAAASSRQQAGKWDALKEAGPVVVAFVCFFLISWFLMQWLTNHGFRIRMPIEW
ncbi:MAG TPA: Mov34/MPN/PAD-1 family protein [Tepidisphaeraceae bacterium]